MPRTRHILTSQLVALAILIGASSSSAQTGLFRGTVVDSHKNVLSGVKVTVTSEQLSSFRKTLTTNPKGQFKLRFQANQTQYNFEMLFEKAGYQSFTVGFSPSATQQMREEYVMETAETKVVTSHGDLGSVVSGSSNAAIEAFNLGLSAQMEGNLDVASEKFMQAVAEDPSLGPAHMALSQVKLDQQEYDAAIGAADQALGLGVNRADALRIKHQSLRALGRTEEADAVALELEAADGAIASAKRLYNEGGVAFQAQDAETALAKFERAAELDPSLVDAHHAIATIQLGKGNHEASADAANKALALGSEDVRTLRVLYDAYDALGRTEDLIEIAPRLAAVDPDFGGPKLVEQAAGLWNNGQTDDAVAAARLALSIDPTLAQPYYFIGLYHLSKDEKAEAKAALGKFVELAPDDPEAATAREMMTYIE